MSNHFSVTERRGGDYDIDYRGSLPYIFLSNSVWFKHDVLYDPVNDYFFTSCNNPRSESVAVESGLPLERNGYLHAQFSRWDFDDGEDKAVADPCTDNYCQSRGMYFLLDHNALVGTPVEGLNEWEPEWVEHVYYAPSPEGSCALGIELEYLTDDGEIITQDLGGIYDYVEPENFLDVEWNIHLTRLGIGNQDGINTRLKIWSSIEESAGVYRSVDLYTSNWVVTDENGRATINPGGTDTAELEGFAPDPQLHVKAWVNVPGYGRALSYLEREFIVDNMQNFKGELTIYLMDPDGNPLAGELEFRGGALTQPGVATIDTSGVGTVDFGGEGGAMTLSVVFAPVVEVDLQIVQNIENPSEIVDEPIIISAKLNLAPGTYSYEGQKKSMNADVHFYKDGNEIAVKKGVTIKQEDDYTKSDLIRWKNRVHITRKPELAEATYSAKVFYNIPGENGPVDATWQYSGNEESTAITVKNKLGRPFNAMIVPVVPEGTTNPDRALADIMSSLGGTFTTALGYMQQLFPIDITFTSSLTGLEANLYPWEYDAFGITGMFRELESYRKSSSEQIDLIIGVVSPGGLGTFLTGKAAGLSQDSYKNVVLIDPSLCKVHHILHEYLHTLGLVDVYENQGVEPASANGYNPKTNVPMYNPPGERPESQAVMYDFAIFPWPTGYEYDNLLDTLTEPVTPPGTPARAADDMGSSGPNQLVMGIHALVGYHSDYHVFQRAPIFTDTGQLHNPNTAVQDQNSLGILTYAGDSLVEATYHHTAIPVINHTGGVANEKIYGIIDFQIPYNSQVDRIDFGIFDSTGNYLRKFSDIGPIWDDIGAASVEFSENPPEVSWSSTPAVNSTLEDDFTFGFSATDQDSESTKLWAWFKMRCDGTSWLPIDNYFVITHGESSITFDSSSFPSANNCTFKLLVTDDGNTTSLEAGPYNIAGYSPLPSALVSPSIIDATVQKDQRTVFSFTIANNGYSRLTGEINQFSLPPWLQVEGPTTFDLQYQEKQNFFIAVFSTETGNETHNILLSTNDPNNGQISVQVNLTTENQAQPPQVLWVGTKETLHDEDDIDLPDSITILARDAHGSDELQLFANVEVIEPEQYSLGQNISMVGEESGGWYSVDLSLPDDLEGKTLGIEVTATDSETNLADENGSNGLGWDFQLLLRKDRNPPLFSNLQPGTDEYNELTVRPGDKVEFTFEVEDPDGGTISYIVHSELPVLLDQEAGKLSTVIPVMRDPWNDKVRYQQIQLLAQDEDGLFSEATWYLYISPYTNSNERAYPWYMDSGLTLTGDSVHLKAFSYANVQGTYCEFYYREKGTQNWHLIGSGPYDEPNTEVVSDGSLATVNWDISSLVNGTRYEVRYQGHWPGGSSDPNPPIVTFIKSGGGAAISSIEVPSNVIANQEIAVTVHVTNNTGDIWSGSTHHLAVPEGLIDPLTGRDEIRLPSAFTQVYPGESIAFTAKGVAPATPGIYTSRWRLKSDAGFLGNQIEATVRVSSSYYSSVLGELIDTLKVISGKQPAVIPPDMNADSRIDLKDSIILLNSLQ